MWYNQDKNVIVTLWKFDMQEYTKNDNCIIAFGVMISSVFKTDTHVLITKVEFFTNGWLLTVNPIHVFVIENKN